jgi:hypothetical protein
LFKFAKPYLLLFNDDKSWYFLDSEGLHVVLVGYYLTQTKLLNNLIMFESSTIADNLCALNDWDRKTLRLHALELGLRFRQIDVIEPALHHLDRDQQAIGSQLLTEYINACTVTPQEEGFIERLIQIGMHFLTEIIKEKVALVENISAQKSTIPSYNEWRAQDPSSHPAVLNELYAYTNLLELLRKYQAQVTASATSTSSAPKKRGIAHKSASFLLSPKSKQHIQDLLKGANNQTTDLKPRLLFSADATNKDVTTEPEKPSKKADKIFLYSSDRLNQTRSPLEMELGTVQVTSRLPSGDSVTMQS